MKKSKFLLLIISLIFLLNIFLFNSFATLYIIKDPEGDFALITNLENIMLKYQLLDYKISIVKESSQKPSIKSQSSSESKPKNRANSQDKNC